MIMVVILVDKSQCVLVVNKRQYINQQKSLVFNLQDGLHQCCQLSLSYDIEYEICYEFVPP